jgi:uncharacterized protein YecE (DUF72 family)
VAEGKYHIGTSGWSYAHWAKGRFYPKGLKQGEWLRFYAEQFATAEVNMTFYRVPKPEMLTRWRDATGPGFCFAIKLWRGITHLARLKNCGESLRGFLKVADELKEKRGPLLVQLPPSMRLDLGLLDAFLSDLGEAMVRDPWRVAVEFRNKESLTLAVAELLDRHDAALCLADMPQCKAEQPNDVPFVYVRRHGPGGRYAGCYSGAHIAADAKRVRGWLDEGRDVYVYYNNDIEGYAIDNALALIARLEPG